VSVDTTEAVLIFFMEAPAVTLPRKYAIRAWQGMVMQQRFGRAESCFFSTSCGDIKAPA
jgi:hypothetical protein